MKAKEMPCITVEQVLRLRDYASTVEYQRDQLHEALKGLQSDCKQGKWIERDRWLQVSKALKAMEE